MQLPELCQPELLVVVIQSMQPREVLKMSLLFPDLFTEGMWRSLIPQWDYYSFLPYSARRKYAETAYRICLLSCTSSRANAHYSVKQQALFAIHKQRKDILQCLVNNHSSELTKLYYQSLTEDRIYFNRPMFNYLASLLKLEVTNRENFIGNPDFTHNYSMENATDYIQMSVLHNNQDLYFRWADKNSVPKDDKVKSRFIETLFPKDAEFWFMIYSRSQEKEILEKLLQESKDKDLSIFGVRTILRNLFHSNHIQLASKFGVKFREDIDLQVILSCLETYYFNSGDDKGLYESLLYMEERKVLKPGVYTFDVELPEVLSLLERNGIKTKKPISFQKTLNNFLSEILSCP
ncbi:hypothetical protein [Cedratvirus kamchatka]|uniref:Uncharacterized protein n=1 Tax=Cedratvirus kamchatka TaxID=2716914 RepID=A0A6G8MYP2_9VIRU|nr:hypothetical protein [Cedratvirus kamchatka]